MPAPQWLATFIASATSALRQRPAATAAHIDPTPSSDWHYSHDYLQGLPSVAPATALPQNFLQAHLLHGQRLGRRSLLLSGVVRLRSHPLLRGVARRIPQHWQTRVKNWLRA